MKRSLDWNDKPNCTLISTPEFASIEEWDYQSIKRRYVKNEFNTKISDITFLCSAWSRSTLSPLFSQKVAFPEWPRKILKRPCANLCSLGNCVCSISAAPSLASTSGTFSSVWASCFPGSTTTYYFCCAPERQKRKWKVTLSMAKKVKFRETAT